MEQTNFQTIEDPFGGNLKNCKQVPKCQLKVLCIKFKNTNKINTVEGQNSRWIANAHLKRIFKNFLSNLTEPNQGL